MTVRVERALSKAFPGQAVEAMATLQAYGAEPYHAEVERVRLAIVRLSDGHLDRLREVTEMACADYRDVLLYAEYPKDVPKVDVAALERWLGSDEAEWTGIPNPNAMSRTRRWRHRFWGSSRR